MRHHILIPVLLKLSTKPFCANRYRMISGTITIRVPVASIQLLYGTETPAELAAQLILA